MSFKISELQLDICNCPGVKCAPIGRFDSMALTLAKLKIIRIVNGFAPLIRHDIGIA